MYRMWEMNEAMNNANATARVLRKLIWSSIFIRASLSLPCTKPSKMLLQKERMKVSEQLTLGYEAIGERHATLVFSKGEVTDVEKCGDNAQSG
jgi:hypothetical protein